MKNTNASEKTAQVKLRKNVVSLMSSNTPKIINRQERKREKKKKKKKGKRKDKKEKTQKKSEKYRDSTLNITKKICENWIEIDKNGVKTSVAGSCAIKKIQLDFFWEA